MISIKRKTINFFYVLIFIVTFFFSTSEKIAFAYFSDTATETIGLKLVLGEMDFEVKEASVNEVITEEKKNIQFSTYTLDNVGTLQGKLAYRIEATGLESQDKISFTINGTSYDAIANTPQYQSLADMEFAPEEIIDINANILVNELPTSDKEVNIKITFLMVQTNSTLEEVMFFDKLECTSTLHVNPEMKNPVEFWPSNSDTRWVSNDVYRYIIQDFDINKVFYYGDILEDGSTSTISKPKVYIEVLEEEADINSVPTNSSFYEFAVKKVSDQKYIVDFPIKGSEARKFLANPAYVQIAAHYSDKNNINKYASLINASPVTKRVILGTDLSYDANQHARFEERKLLFSHKKKESTIPLITLSPNNEYSIWATYGKEELFDFSSYDVKASITSTQTSLEVFTTIIKDNKIEVKVNTEEAKKINMLYEGTLRIQLSKKNSDSIIIERAIQYTPSKGNSSEDDKEKFGEYSQIKDNVIVPNNPLPADTETAPIVEEGTELSPSEEDKMEIPPEVVEEEVIIEVPVEVEEPEGSEEPEPSEEPQEPPPVKEEEPIEEILEQVLDEEKESQAVKGIESNPPVEPVE